MLGACLDTEECLLHECFLRHLSSTNALPNHPTGLVRRVIDREPEQCSGATGSHAIVLRILLLLLLHTCC